MSKDLWEEDDANGEFRDIPEETKLDPSAMKLAAAPASPASQNRPTNAYAASESLRKAAPAQPVREEEVEVEVDADDEDFTDVLNDANLRIEQGRLYQMIMNHALFEGMEADPKAVQNVQKEIRKFARERMEIMLGMRQEVSKVEHLEINFPFNAMEVTVLKSLASAATKGASENADNFVPEVRRTIESVPNIPKRQTLNPLGGSTALKRSAPPVQKLSSKAAAPVARKKLDPTAEQILAEEGVDRALIEEDYKPIGKKLSQMTEQEIIDRNKEASKRQEKHRTVKSSNAIPMATPEQQAMLAIQRADQISSAPGMATLLNKVKSMPSTNT